VYYILVNIYGEEEAKEKRALGTENKKKEKGVIENKQEISFGALKVAYTATSFKCSLYDPS
jgi:hypothetical protein